VKVIELIEILKECDPDAIVVCQKDAEGNGYSPLADVASDNEGYIAERPWFGDRVLRQLTQEAINDGYTEDDVDESAVPAVFLTPTN